MKKNKKNLLLAALAAGLFICMNYTQKTTMSKRLQLRIGHAVESTDPDIAANGYAIISHKIIMPDYPIPPEGN